MKTIAMKLYLLLLASAVTFAAGCGDDQDVDDGSGTKTDASTPADSAADSNSQSDTAATDSSSQSDAADLTNIIIININGKEYNVDLTQLSTKPIKDLQGYQLMDIWIKTGNKAMPSQMDFDFVGSDGFHSSSKEPCKKFKAGEKFDYGFVLPPGGENSKKLIWDDEKSGAPKCMNVKNLKSIIATPQK